MALIEIILLVIAYTILVVTIFLQYVCYKRNLETKETIFFSLSLLFLIVSFTISPFANTDKSQEFVTGFRQFSFLLVGLSTPLNIFTERDYSVNPIWKKLLIITFMIFVVAIILGTVFHISSYFDIPTILFLGISVLSSMIFIYFTSPIKKLKNKDRIQRKFAIAFMILVPLSLLSSFAFNDVILNIGFTIPLIFILLTGVKLIDDIQRLSLINPKIEPKEQNLLNYQLTEREKEISHLLTEGKTYKQISEELFISIPTVKTHTSNIYRKCGVNTRSEFTYLITK